jgi:carbon starvation protein
MLRICARHLSGKPVPPLSETPHQATQLEEAAWARD